MIILSIVSMFNSLQIVDPNRLYSNVDINSSPFELCEITNQFDLQNTVVLYLENAHHKQVKSSHRGRL